MHCLVSASGSNRGSSNSWRCKFGVDAAKGVVQLCLYAVSLSLQKQRFVTEAANDGKPFDTLASQHSVLAQRTPQLATTVAKSSGMAERPRKRNTNNNNNNNNNNLNHR